MMRGFNDLRYNLKRYYNITLIIIFIRFYILCLNQNI